MKGTLRQRLIHPLTLSGVAAVAIAAFAVTEFVILHGDAPASAATSNTTGATCTQSSAVYICALPTTGQTSVDVASLASQLAADGITSGTPIWIQAWGGHGGMGGGFENGSRASGGSGGFAQTVMTLDQLESTYGTSTLYYYTGDAGLNHGSSTSDTPGGDGAASSVVATADLSSATPSIDVDDPAQGNVLLLAGGGGGSGGNNENINSLAETGGDGGVAVATASKSVAAPGGQGTDKSGTVSDHSGDGGQCPDGGAKGSANGANGAWGTSGVGGTGGGGGQTNSGHYSPTGWTNSTDTKLADAGSGGHGAPGVYEAIYGNAGAGGGGGGGWGGGGGGGAAYGDSDPGAGGGGCSFAAEDLASDPLAPTGGQSNPNGDAGYVQLVFDPVNSTATFDVPTPASPGDSGTFTAKYTTAAGSSTVTFYAAGGTLTGAWDGADQTLSSGSGQVDLETSEGKPLSQVVGINQGASITPVPDGTDCDGEDQWLLSGSVTINNVRHFDTVSGDADLTGCGDITGEVTYNGALSDLEPSEIDWATVSNLDFDMTPATVVKAAPRQKVHKPIYARVGCLDQRCRVRLKGVARIDDHGPVKKKGLEKKVIRVKKGQVRRVHLRFKHHHQRKTRRLRRELSHGQQAQLRVGVKSTGARGPVGHSRLRIKLRP